MTTKTTCTEPRCRRLAAIGGLCRSHYDRQRYEARKRSQDASGTSNADQEGQGRPTTKAEYEAWLPAMIQRLGAKVLDIYERRLSVGKANSKDLQSIAALLATARPAGGPAIPARSLEELDAQDQEPDSLPTLLSTVDDEAEIDFGTPGRGYGPLGSR
jgi:hypothetical protein